MNTPIKIDRARWWALTQPAAVFYGSLATNLTDVMDPSVETAATDGKRILWNPDFVEKLTDEEVRFVLLHETLHCAHDHFSRLPLTMEGNIAGDYAINLLLEKIPGIKAPDGALLDRAYADLAEEEILARLPKRPPGNKGGKPGNKGGKGQPGQPSQSGQPDPNGDPGGCGKFIAPAGNNPEKLKQEWEKNVVAAAHVAKSLNAGPLPADMQRKVDRIRAVDVDWRREMADFIKSAIGDRADWSRSCRRMATAPVIYPRRARSALGTVVVARDTSGSIDNELVADFCSQISSISGDLACEVLVIDCDADIHQELRLGPGEECPLEAKGGGGTAFQPVFDRIAQLQDDGEQFAGIVYLTDLCSSDTPTDLGLPTLWAAYGTSQQGPFGKTIHVK